MFCYGVIQFVGVQILYLLLLEVSLLHGLAGGH
jgi:hypothetical protein